MAYNMQGGQLADSVESDLSISMPIADAIVEFIGDLEDDGGNVQVDVYDPSDPDSPPPEGTDVVAVAGGGAGPVSLNVDNLGSTPFIDGREADGGIYVDLTGEGDTTPVIPVPDLPGDKGSFFGSSQALDSTDQADSDVPETRVILGSDANDTVLGGQSNLIVDLGAGDDLLVTGDGDDNIAMGSGDDTVRLGGGGNDTIDGGDGDDSLRLSGYESDWMESNNGDGTVTWTNVSTGQMVTAVNIETITFELHDDSGSDYLPSKQADELDDHMDHLDPDDV